MKRRKRILIVEDHKMNLELLRDLLEYHGYDVIDASDGESGIEKAMEHKPDLILMDIALPGINGFEAADEIKSRALIKDIPLLAVTSSVMQSDVEQIFQHGFTDLVPKPVNTREFLQTIKKYF